MSRGLRAPPLCQNTSFAVCGRKVLPLKSPWARPRIVTRGGFSAAHSLQCQARIAAPDSQLLRGALIFLLPQLLSPRGRARSGGEPELFHLLVLAVSRRVVSPLLAHSRTQRARAPGTIQACLHPGPLVPGGLEPVCCLSHWYGACWVVAPARGTRWHRAFGPHVVVSCVQG